MEETDIRYSLRYLPVFYDDMEEIVDYIVEVLQNPAAADKLLDKVSDAIMERLPAAEFFEKYRSRKERRTSYYRIYVDSYIIYYVVIPVDEHEKVMEVRRILHRLQDRGKYI